MTQSKLCALLSIGIGLWALQAHSRPPAVTDPTLAPWFRSLRNPVTDISCCDTADGHILADHEWRIQGNKYQIRVNGEWQDVPPEAVLDHIGNPTGGAVAFYLPNISTPRIYCFILPAMG